MKETIKNGLDLTVIAELNRQLPPWLELGI